MKQSILKGTGTLQFYAGMMLAAYSIQALIMAISTLHYFIKPDSNNRLTPYVNLTELFMANKPIFAVVMLALISISLLKVQIWLKVFKVIKDFTAENPFKATYLDLFQKIMLYLSSIIALSLGLKVVLGWLRNTYTNIPKIDLGVEEYIFMTILLYILFNGFKKGLNLQEEQDLTV